MGRVLGMTCLSVLALASPAAQGETLASTIEVYVFPTEGQDAGQQSTDEAACYEWAVSNTGSDPFNLSKQEQADDQQAQAWGAAAGAIRGRRQGKAAQQQAQQQVAQQAEQREEATAEQLENFKKAFSVCLEAKDYMVKY
jgi:hypothetical protein